MKKSLISSTKAVHIQRGAAKMTLLFVLCVLSFFSCKSKPLDPSKPIYVEIVTSIGEVEVILYDDTPLHRDNFVKLCQSGFYEGVLFHRIIKDFVVQGGDPESKKREAGVLYGNNDGGFTIPAEIRPNHFNKRGALIDAKESDDINPERLSAGTQFCFVQGRTYTDKELDEREEKINSIHRNWLYHCYKKLIEKEQPNLSPEDLEIEISLRITDTINESGLLQIPAEHRAIYKTIGGVPHLDGSVTVFGEVTEGLNIIEKMSLVKTDKNDRPLHDVLILSTKVFQR